MNSKQVWPIVKFIVAATGLQRADARKILEELPKDRHSQLYLKARAWERDTDAMATKALDDVVGDAKVPTLVQATTRAITPSHVQDEEDAAPRRRKTRK